MPLLIELREAGTKLRQKYSTPLLPAEQIFSFPTSTGDFVSTGVTSTDEFASVLDGDPVVRTFDNFTINTGHIVRPSNRCKGLFICVKGDLIVNGRLSMSSRGASAPGKYVGIDPLIRTVYFDTVDKFTEHDNIFCIHPDGGIGGARVSATSSGINVHRYTTGNSGAAGTNGACGGGGSGGAYASHGGTVQSGAGAAGTSFSGGAGGGGCGNDQSSVSGYAGTINGGPGGAGRIARFSGATTPRGVGGGAGNPGGVRASTNGGSAEAGQTGTGGLMILFVLGDIVIGPNGAIESNGANGGYGISMGGGGSGAGAIHIFHRGTLNDITKILVNGGLGGSCTAGYFGGKGGDGTVNIVQV